MQDGEIKIGLGLSPCPNDTFIFHALLHDLVKPRFPRNIRFEMVMADIERLNSLALEGKLEVSKISVGVLPHILDKYRVLSAGGALGWGCGPLVVAREPLDGEQLKSARTAIPGKMTTANMLLNLRGGFNEEREAMLFSEIMPAVREGRVDVGVIIHEGRFTFQNLNLCKILDLGQWWEERYGMPLPLGVIVARRDVPIDIVRAVNEAITQSLRHAWQNRDASRNFIREHAREMADDVTAAHIETFVTAYSENLGESGKKAIQAMLAKSVGDKNGAWREDLFVN